MNESPYPYDVKDSPPPPPTETTRFPNKTSPLLVLGMVGIVFLLMNLSLVPVGISSDGPYTLAENWMSFCLGGIGGPAAMLAIFGVFGPGKLLVRHAIAMAIGSLLIIFFFAGALAGDWMRNNKNYHPTPGETVPGLLAIPAIFLACEIPLWFFRIFLNWRVEQPRHAAVARPQR